MAFSDTFNISVRASKAQHNTDSKINLGRVKETTNNQREMASAFKTKRIASSIT